MNRILGLALICLLVASGLLPVFAADEEELDELREALEEIAVIDKKVMVPMRDGVRLATDIYRPKDAGGPLPTIFVRTPYNFNEAGKRRLEAMTDWIERGYAYVIQNERGKFFSEGEWEILGFPRTDGWDALDWIAAQPWSNGKVGTLGCSSSAEWQMALAAMDHPAHAAMVPMAAGAGIGRVGEFYEQGNWYRGGVYQMLFGSWLYGVQNTQRPRLPEGLPREDIVRLSRYFDLAPDMPEVDWPEHFEHLPLVTMMEEIEGPEGMYAEFIQRLPDDPAWYKGGLYHDDEPWGVPALWMNSWYDISQGPNLALFNHVRESARDPEVRDGQYVVIAPTPHCRFQTDKKETVVGERSIGDVRFDYEELTARWFDYWLKGDDNGVLGETPRVQYYTMGLNQWQSADSWPPAGVEIETWYLASDGRANSLFGDGRLVPAPPEVDTPDRFTYDPTVPVPSLGGGVCCNGGAVEPGGLRPARYRGAARRAGLHQRAARRTDRDHRHDRGDALGRLGRPRHRLLGQACRRPARRHRLQHRRNHPAGALPRRLRQAGVHGAGRGLRARGDADVDQYPNRSGPSDPGRGVEQQLSPALRAISIPAATTGRMKRAWWRTTRYTTRSSTPHRSGCRSFAARTELTRPSATGTYRRIGAGLASRGGRQRPVEGLDRADTPPLAGGQMKEITGTETWMGLDHLIRVQHIFDIERPDRRNRRGCEPEGCPQSLGSPHGQVRVQQLL